jgi:hypothetical protein
VRRKKLPVTLKITPKWGQNDLSKGVLPYYNMELDLIPISGKIYE